MKEIVYNLMSSEIEYDYRERYRIFTYDMYALCKRLGCPVDFLGRGYDYDDQMDADTAEERFTGFLCSVSLFVGVIDDDTEFPSKYIKWALNNYFRKRLLVLIRESHEEKAAPISRKSLKYKLYFEKKIYPQSFWGGSEFLFWIGVHVMLTVGLSSDIIRIKEDVIYFDDVYIGHASEIFAISNSFEYRKARENGVDKDRLALDIIRAIFLVVELQSYRLNDELHPIIDAQLRGDNLGVSLLLNHQELCSELMGQIESIKKNRSYGMSDSICILLIKMELGLLNSNIVNFADENREEYAEMIQNDIKKFRTRLKRLKVL